MLPWKPPQRPDVILLDLDGTLTDSAQAIMTSMRHALREHGLEAPNETVLRSFVGPPFAVVLRERGLDAEQIKSVVAAYRADYNGGRLFETRVFPGIEHALAQFVDAGVRLAVATSKPQEPARRIVEHFGLQKYLVNGIESVFGSDVSRPAEDKADVIARALPALERPELDAARHDTIVMVGDRLHDVHGAAAHGIPCLGVAWGYAAEGELLEAGAAGVVETPAELVEVLRQTP